ncbi:secreted RxLR effector protein 161-like [Lathyrus oleraceus]|uniref:secreted RxLR effector protein 161-like n=1 Tax=Pisum sativum TaxID=3888 RepID=UPI0021D3A175|nr:secreted RxLR effector protein 161-like [Pisum sativum]
MIGSLLYLTASRWDIMFSVCMCARYQSAPKELHLKAVKHILRYFHGTSKYGLWHSKGSDYNLVDYSDSDFFGCELDRKSTSGIYHMFSNSLVSWHSKKQVFVALSTDEAEYAATVCHYYDNISVFGSSGGKSIYRLPRAHACALFPEH